MPRTYANNAQNQSLGRVGMTHGSAVYSASSGTVTNRLGGGSSYSAAPAPSASAYSSYSGGSTGYSSSSTSSKAYVDNAQNRNLGRVGLAHGTAVQHKSGAYSSSSPSAPSGPSSSVKTYVDNAHNRSLDRVGLDHGAAVDHKSLLSELRSKQMKEVPFDSSSKYYVDNAKNRELGRVGYAYGTAVNQKSSPSSSTVSPKTYVDNALNRRLGRVGLPHGTAVEHKKVDVYVDNFFNRQHNRVGKPLGSSPVSRPKKPKAVTEKYSKDPKELYDYFHGIEDGPDWDVFMDQDVDDVSHAKNLARREQESMRYQENCTTDMDPSSKSRVSAALLKKFQGCVIKYEDLKLGKEIGQGSFGVVYFATLDNEWVAVKKLKLQQLTKKRMKQLEDEATLFSYLDHPNILKLVGICMETPNLALVLEFMDMSLFEALHMKGIDFNEGSKLSMMQQMTKGLNYLHSKEVAHCDMKSQNILLANVPGEKLTDSSHPIRLKLTDFGLSLLKSDSDTSVSHSEAEGRKVSRVGTPRYAAPEILRGERLTLAQLKTADVYSLGLLIHELITEEIPFEDLNMQQLIQNRGVKGERPDMPDWLRQALRDVFTSCLAFDVKERGSAQYVDALVEKITSLYPTEE